MYHIRRKENADEAQIERTEPAVSYDKVVYSGNEVKLMYRTPDGEIKRFWVGEHGGNELENVSQVYIMNNNGKTIERI